MKRFLTALGVAIINLCAVTVCAQPKTDVITFASGDRITGEILELNRGRLEVKTDDAGTLDIEWDKIAKIQAIRMFEVGTSDGQRVLGSLNQNAEGTLLVTPFIGDALSFPMMEVTSISAIGASFWARLDGSIDAGFNYTRSSGIAQTTVNSDTQFRRPAFLFRLTTSATLTSQSGEEPDDRADIEFSYERYRWKRWYFAGAAQFESNESLGLVLRSQVAGTVGERLVNTNKAQFSLGGGLVVNDEKAVDAPEAQNLEAVIAMSSSYYRYDRPRTTLDATFQYYPSLSNWGRQRIQASAYAKRELWKDFIVSVNVYDTFDSEPPNPTAIRNDVGTVASVGWSY